MPTRRQQRLNELLREELSLLIPGRLDDPRVMSASVTRVETTQDMTTAKVYVTVQGSDEDARAALAGLQHAGSFLRSQIGDLGLRRLPELVFARDREFESGERVLAILSDLSKDSGEALPGGSSEAGKDTRDEPDLAPGTDEPSAER